MQVIPDIISQHAEEAAFLWLLRDDAVCAPNYDLKDLAELDERVEAHIDGLRIAEDFGWQLCKEQLALEEPGEVFAAGVLAFESGDQDRIDAVLEVGCSSRELSRALISALGWIPYERVQEHITTLLSAESPALRYIGIAGSAIHRINPGRPLIEAQSNDNLLLRARALKAAGELGLVDRLNRVKRNYENDDEWCRYYAAWSGILLGDKHPISVLQELVRADFPKHEEALRMAVLGMDHAEALAWQEELAKDSSSLRLAAKAAGVIGDPVNMTWLIEQMAISEVARVAGEAFSMITGIDIAYDDLEGEWPEGFEAGPTEDPEDEDVDMDPDEDLPWPESELISKWWDKHKKNFSNGTYYFMGRPLTSASTSLIMRTGTQPQRYAAALSSKLNQPNQALFETRSPGVIQQRQIKKMNL